MRWSDGSPPPCCACCASGTGWGPGGEGGGGGGRARLGEENAPRGGAPRWASFPPMGAPVGFVFANGFYLLLGMGLTNAQLHEWGWRLPFLRSSGLGALGLWVRLSL